MSDKKSNDDLRRALRSLAKQNPFDKFIREVETTHIPAEFIQHVTIHYVDGTVVELDGDDVYTDVHVQRGKNSPPLTDANNEKIADVRVFVDTEKLQKFVDDQIDELFDRHNIL